MTDTRKDLRFKLPAASGPDFEAAKRRAEKELGVAMTANEFAKRVVVQAVRKESDRDTGAWADDDKIRDIMERFAIGNHGHQFCVGDRVSCIKTHGAEGIIKEGSEWIVAENCGPLIIAIREGDGMKVYADPDHMRLTDENC